MTPQRTEDVLPFETRFSLISENLNPKLSSDCWQDSLPGTVLLSLPGDYLFRFFPLYRTICTMLPISFIHLEIYDSSVFTTCELPVGIIMLLNLNANKFLIKE